MEEKKRHKLILIAPSGKEYKLGFLSPCKNGIVVGTARIEEVDTSHLTVLFNEESISSHITPQDGVERRRYFPLLNMKEMAKKFQTIVEDNLISPLSPDEMSQEVFYLTKDFENWFNKIQTSLYQERVSSKEIIHILNFKNLLEELPQLIEEITKSPSSYFGLCKASQILEDKSKIAGFTNSRLLVIPFENQLYVINFPLLTDFTFKPTLERGVISAPLDEIYRGMGIPQYIEEIEKKKFLERLLSKDK